jgi:cobalt-precorrin-5B (C1)-methyltransferase
VRKPATDDPDATRGVVVVVSLRPAAGLSFRAGPGVGVVGRPGLALPPGEAAINPGPRAQIGASLREVGDARWAVTVSVPTGVVVASRTFNGKLGIEGGISILGTAGVVRPWCEQAMVQAVRTHLNVVRAAGQSVALLVPGHMGAAAARRCFPHLEAVEVGNAWGASLDVLRTHGFREAVLVGHAGKLVKLAQGQWNTHSGAGSSAASWASRLLRRCRGVRFAGDTLEELVKTAGRSDVDLLAEAVARAVCRRSGLGVRVLFTDLAGEIVGEGEKQ